MTLDAKIPRGDLEHKWTDYKDHVNLVSPANKRKLEVIVIGTGLAGASAAATLGELGYKVKAFCFQDSPPAGHTALQHREELMRQKIIRMMGILFFVFFMIQ